MSMSDRGWADSGSEPSSAPTTDASLLHEAGDVEAVERDFVAGTHDALRAVYQLHGSLIFSYCRRALGHDLAADATQETFISAWRSRTSFDPERGALAGWLIGIARFKVLEQLRRSGRTAQPAGDAGTLELVGADTHRISKSSADPDIESIADRMLLVDALGQLEPRVRMVLELAFLENLTHTEVAERCGLPLGTVKSDIRRGVERLRRQLAGRMEADHG